MQPDDFPRIAIRCKNPQCRDRGRVLAETDGARLWFGDTLYVERAQTFHCAACDWRVVWQPRACYTVREEVAV